MARHREYVGPCIAEELCKRLPLVDESRSIHVLPDGTHCLVGVENVYAMNDTKPQPVQIDLGGSQPFTLWK